MNRSNYSIFVGVVMFILAAVFLTGWNLWDWSFVDPYFCTLMLVGSPFFFWMGFGDPQVERGQANVRVRV
jgi:hypothetical protein